MHKSSKLLRSAADISRPIPRMPHPSPAYISPSAREEDGRLHKSFLLALMLYLLSLCLAFQSGASGEKAGEYVIHVDVESKTLTLFQGNAAVRRYTIATGAWDTPTPWACSASTPGFPGR